MATTAIINSEVPLKNDTNNDLEEPMELDEDISKLLSDKEDGEEGELSDSSVEDTTQVHSRYENKDEDFATGIDLFQKEDQGKLEERAKRFLLDSQETKHITEDKITELYLSMGLSDKDSENKHIRLTALHMRGTDDLSTKDIFSYFQEFAPASVEWINDTSCNVVWLDQLSPARALLALSKPIIGKEKNPLSVEEKDTEKKSTQMEIKEIRTKEGDVIMVVDENIDSSLKEDTEGVLTSAIEAPIPPGKWRLANKHPKAKALLLRFAAKSDKKPPNAEKMSEYYRKHGNPNYGGIKGIITTSRKRKIRGIESDTKNPWGDLALNWNSNSNNNLNIVTKNKITNNLNRRVGSKSQIHNPRIGNQSSSIHPSDSSDSEDMNWSSRVKIPRMRMRADEEEARVEKRKAKTKTHLSVGVNRSRDSLAESAHDLRNKLRVGRVAHKRRHSESHSESENEQTTFSSDLRNTLRGKSGRDIQAQDLRSKLNSRKDKTLYREKSPLQIEFDNDQYYEIVGSDQD